MHSSCTDRPTYTGARAFPFVPPFTGPMMGHHVHPEPHGFCQSCCHPRSRCVCNHRQCRKEAKELLVNAEAVSKEKLHEIDAAPVFHLMKAGLKVNTEAAAAATMPAAEALAAYAVGTAFIGGGCCVHLSIEYMANNPTMAAAVGVVVTDSEGTTLMWAKSEKVGIPYQVKEGILTTKPGAKLVVVAVNATARVRWCEIFSC